MSFGYLTKKFNIFPEQTPQVLNLYIIYVSLPAMVFLQIPKIAISSEIFIPMILPWVVTILGAIAILLFSKIFHWNKKTIGALMLVAVLGNTSFLGIPIVTYYYGEAGLPYVMIYDQIGSFLALSTYGAVIVAMYSSDDKIHIKKIAKKVWTFPPFVALVIAAFLHGVEFDTEITKLLQSIANTIVPVALLSVGYSLQLKVPKEHWSAFALGLTTKLIIIPLFAFAIVYMFDLKGLVTNVSVLESAMGPMITAGAVASMAGFSNRLSASIVGYGVVLSFFTTAVVYNFLGF